MTFASKMLQTIVGAWNKFWGFLANEHMPIWLTLLLFLATGTGTYFIAPLINENFEMQKIRSAYVVKSIDSINSDSQDILQAVSIAIHSTADGKPISASTIEEARKKFVSLQWKTRELDIIFSEGRYGDDDIRSHPSVSRFSEAVERIREAFESFLAQKNSQNATALIDAAARFSVINGEIIALLAEQAGIGVKPSILPFSL